jgi:NAD-dependent SIR2 family protein deacetylase
LKYCVSCGKDAQGGTTVMPFYTHQKEYPLCPNCKESWSIIFDKFIKPLMGKGEIYRTKFNENFYKFIEDGFIEQEKVLLN